MDSNIMRNLRAFCSSGNEQTYPFVVNTSDKCSCRESYLNACRVIVAGSRKFFDYDLMSRELDRLFKESEEFVGCEVKVRWQSMMGCTNK